MVYIFKISAGIPPPVKRNRYPWNLMEVGDSFFVPDTLPSNVSSAVAHVHNRSKKRFRSQRRVVKGVTGTRVWRVK